MCRTVDAIQHLLFGILQFHVDSQREDPDAKPADRIKAEGCSKVSESIREMQVMLRVAQKYTTVLCVGDDTVSVISPAQVHKSAEDEQTKS